jgi:hypothetical protein
MDPEEEHGMVFIAELSYKTLAVMRAIVAHEEASFVDNMLERELELEVFQVEEEEPTDKKPSKRALDLQISNALQNQRSTKQKA